MGIKMEVAIIKRKAREYRMEDPPVSINQRTVDDRHHDFILESIETLADALLKLGDKYD